MSKVLKSQIMYIRFDYKNRYLMNLISFLAFAGIYSYCLVKRSDLMSKTMVDDLLLSNYLLLYIIARIVLSGISIPYEVLNTEYVSNNLILKQSIIGYDIEWLLSIRIFLMIFKSFLINVFSFVLIMSVCGYIIDIKNYFVLIIPIFVGTFFVAFIGYLVSSILQYLDVKREFISIAQAGLIIAFLSLSQKDNYFLPFTIIRNQISGILKSDLIFAELGISQALSLSWYWIIIFIASVILIILISYFVNIFYHRKEYKNIKR